MPNYTRDQAREHIAQLVQQFQQSEATLVHSEEAMIENNFVRPLFRYLNWNVDNTGLSEPQWEFVLQRTMREGNRPDYILQLDGQQLFVMDAKKAKYDMHDTRWLNQVYAYAYSTQNNAPSKKIDFAILTDFQEFVVLDCTQLVKPHALTTLRVLDWRYTDYVERFDELWDLFERGNVLGTLRERTAGIWARKLTTKQAKANRIPPDKAFLAALDDEKAGWRVRLAKDMKKNNPSLGGEVLTAAVQLLIDRLIFVKVLSDREIEQDYLKQMAELVERDGLSENNRGWFAACKNLFAELNAMYNGSIFAPRAELETVAVSNQVVREIIADLQPENSPYNFAVLPVEILGTIYERFLGRVVYATDARVKIEDKPEVRKAGGVYYTPQYIVEYIVKQTVGKLLADCKTPADVAQLKILDPACGSGSFLLGAYEALIEWHRAYYATEDEGRKTKASGARSSLVVRPSSAVDAYYRDEDGRVRLTAKLKRQILLNNIFGVDIDPQAVEVTRLSLSLKALEDTRSDEAHHERTLFNQTLLPDLSANIKCGNSLIGTDYLCVDDAELRRVKPFDWASEFPSVFNRAGLNREVAKNAKEEQGFDAVGQRPDGFPKTRQVSDADARGFDAVIGNPPYVLLQDEFRDDVQLRYFRERYQSASFKLDTYHLFIEESIRLGKPGAWCSLITPANFLTNNHLMQLRRFMVANSKIEQIIVIDGGVFRGISVDNAIFVVRSGKQTENEFSVILANVANETVTQRQTIQVQVDRVTADAHALFTGASEKSGSDLFEKILRQSTLLGDMTDVNFGKQLRDRKKYPGDVIELSGAKKVSVPYKPCYTGRDVTRYHLEWHNLVCFDQEEARSGGCWDAEKQNAKNKLVTRQIGQYPDFALDVRGYQCLNTMFMVNLTDHNYNAKYILGILNSSVTRKYWLDHFYDQRKTFPKIKGTYLKKLPIRTINFADASDRAAHDQMVQFVERMLALHKSRASAQTETDRELYQRQIEATDKAIDVLVYQLYQLTDEEIKIVEGK